MMEIGGYMVRVFQGFDKEWQPIKYCKTKDEAYDWVVDFCRKNHAMMSDFRINPVYKANI